MSRSSATWAVALTSVTFFMGALDALVVITALPAVHKEIGGSLSALEWTINAYTVLLAAGIITAAALGDRLGRRRVYVFGLYVFSLASAACALSPNIAVLVAARAVQGVGAAIILPLSLTILTSSFPAERRGAIVGLWGGIGGLAVALGPLVGGAVTQGLSWHWIFWVNVPIGLAAALLSPIRLPESRGARTRLDVPGLFLLTAGAVSVLWGLIRSTDIGWGSTEVTGALVLGGLLVAGFVAWEARAAAPMLPLRLLTIRPFAAAVGTGFLMTGSIISAAFLASQFFQFGLGYTPLETGLRFLPWTGTAFIIAPLAGRLSDRIGTRPLMVAGLLMNAVGLAWMAQAAGAGVGYEKLLPPLVLGGIGASMGLTTTPTAALSAVPPIDIGKASGVVNMLQRFGAAFAVAVVSAVFAANGSLTSAVSVSAGFKPATAVVAGMSAVGAVLALNTARRRKAVSAAPAVELNAA
ncbi:MAG TPA: DHA2 family efflux MFS transporter permease subunit [Candidatus Dormibacteraeota bacterium]|nr:DHA2 family efflux MFS transporter permease subunit [Candidatus Dormibacteraeota bacterium]